MLDFLKQKNTEKLNDKDNGFNEDLIKVLQNLVHIESHCIDSWIKTKDDLWLQVNEEARKDRTELLDLIVKKSEGEEWCLSKHTLVVILGLIELGNRKYSSGEIEEGKKYFDKAGKWLGIFLVKNKL
jgi:hypothetical protein